MAAATTPAASTNVVADLVERREEVCVRGIAAGTGAATDELEGGKRSRLDAWRARFGSSPIGDGGVEGPDIASSTRTIVLDLVPSKLLYKLIKRL